MNGIATTTTAAAPAETADAVIAPASTTSPAAASDDAAFRAKATAAAEKFEGFFIAQMLKQMRASTRELADAGSVFKDPTNADMLSLADSLMADQMAGRHAFGIADAILRQLLPATTAAPATQAGATPLNPGASAVASRS